MGTRGGRPEPQAVVSRTAGRNSRAQRGRVSDGARPGGSRQPPAGPARSAQAAPASPVPTGPPAWFRWTTLALSLIGLGVSIYLTYTHLTESAVAACPDTGAINCTKVTTSPQSMVFGIFPVAELGLAFYVFMVAVNSPWGWRARWAAVRWARLIGVIIGIVFVLYLIYVELFVVNAICLWCTSVHVVTFLLFVLTMYGAAAWGLSRANAE